LGGAGPGGARRGGAVWVVAHVVVALGFGLGGSCFGHVHVGLHVVQLVQLAGFLQANVLGDLVDVTWDETNKNLSIETKKKFSQRHTNGVKQTNELNITKENRETKCKRKRTKI
jgi:hypothetical protein